MPAPRNTDPGSTSAVQQALAPWASLIVRKAQQYGVPPAVLAGVVYLESGGNPNARNGSSGATGLGQVMPQEAGFPGRPTVAQLQDPETNLDWSARILADGYHRYGQNGGIASYLGAVDPRTGQPTGATDANGTSGTSYVTSVLGYASHLGDWIASHTGASTAEAAGNQTMPNSTDPNAQPFVWPVQGQTYQDALNKHLITERYGDPQTIAPGYDEQSVGTPTQLGTDIAAPQGTTLVAPATGSVSFAGYQGPYGNTVVIKGTDGTYYRLAHLSSLGVQQGDNVQAGKPVGAVGATGNATGPHVHLEVYTLGKNGTPTWQDPEQVASQPTETRKQQVADAARDAYQQAIAERDLQKGYIDSQDTKNADPKAYQAAVTDANTALQRWTTAQNDADNERTTAAAARASTEHTVSPGQRIIVTHPDGTTEDVTPAALQNKTLVVGDRVLETDDNGQPTGKVLYDAKSGTATVHQDANGEISVSDAAGNVQIVRPANPSANYTPGQLASQNADAVKAGADAQTALLTLQRLQAKIASGQASQEDALALQKAQQDLTNALVQNDTSLTQNQTARTQSQTADLANQREQQRQQSGYYQTTDSLDEAQKQATVQATIANTAAQDATNALNQRTKDYGDLVASGQMTVPDAMAKLGQFKDLLTAQYNNRVASETARHNQIDEAQKQEAEDRARVQLAQQAESTAGLNAVMHGQTTVQAPGDQSLSVGQRLLAQQGLPPAGDGGDVNSKVQALLAHLNATGGPPAPATASSQPTPSPATSPTAPPATTLPSSESTTGTPDQAAALNAATAAQATPPDAFSHGIGNYQPPLPDAFSHGIGNYQPVPAAPPLPPPAY